MVLKAVPESKGGYQYVNITYFTVGGHTSVRLAIFAFVIYAAVQGVKALRKYNRSGEVRKEKAETRRSLGRS